MTAPAVTLQHSMPSSPGVALRNDDGAFSATPVPSGPAVPPPMHPSRSLRRRLRYRRTTMRLCGGAPPGLQSETAAVPLVALLQAALRLALTVPQVPLAESVIANTEADDPEISLREEQVPREVLDKPEVQDSTSVTKFNQKHLHEEYHREVVPASANVQRLVSAIEKKP